MSHELSIRAATADDAETIVAFNCRLAEESENKRLDLQTVRAGVDALLADRQKGRYFVATRGGRIVGQVMITFEWSDWRNGQIWWLQSVYVEPQSRRQGVFRRLFEHVLQTAEAESVAGVRLYVEQNNGRAQAAYFSQGMQPAGYIVLEQMAVASDARWTGDVT